ncbi:MAG: hypothetical protein ABI273_00585 [Lacunisphaera sp.]
MGKNCAGENPPRGLTRLIGATWSGLPDFDGTTFTVRLADGPQNLREGPMEVFAAVAMDGEKEVSFREGLAKIKLNYPIN